MDFLVLADIHHRWKHLEKMISMAGDFDGVLFLGDLKKHGSKPEDVSIAIRNFAKIHEAARCTIGVPGNGAIPEIVRHLDELGISAHGKSHILDDVGFFGVGGSPDPVAIILAIRSFFRNETYSAIELSDRTVETLDVFGVSIRDGVFVVDDWSEMQVNLLKRFRGPFDHTEGEIHEFLVQGHQSISECSFRVLLSHVPPYEPVLNTKFPEGVSTGSQGISEFIHNYRPSVVLSGHYHISHEFQIGHVPCFIIPAVTDGFYSIFRIDQGAEEFNVTVKTF